MSGCVVSGVENMTLPDPRIVLWQQYKRLFDAGIVSTLCVAINWTPHSWGVKAHKNEDGFLLFISQFKNKNFTVYKRIHPLIP